jgi:hypothetical protein
MGRPPFVVTDADTFEPDAVFIDGRDQILLGVQISDGGIADLSLLALVIDEANARGFSMGRFEPYGIEMLLCLFEEYDEPEVV